ncbi:MAG: hypothetical protein ACO24P_00105 [Candidatus Nanopelagicaceae bacterium]
MVLARFEFRPECADQFAWKAGQNIVEMIFDNVFDLVNTCKELEDAIVDCTAIIDGHVINLQALSV